MINLKLFKQFFQPGARFQSGWLEKLGVNAIGLGATDDSCTDKKAGELKLTIK